MKIIITTKLLLLLSFPAFSQHALLHPNLNIDTSYTVFSAYKKHIKKYPEISIAKYKPVNKIKEHRNLSYFSHGKRKMHLDLFEPGTKTKKNRPCVILVHGGGWSTGDKSLPEPFALALCDTGFVSVCIEYRFSGEAKYPAAVTDVKTAVKWVYANAKKYRIDTTKIAILGSSAGGQLAALVGVTSQTDKFDNPKAYPGESSKISAIIDLDGVIAFIHPLSEEGGKPGKPGSAEKWFGVHYQTDPAKWIEASAITYVDEHTPPSLFIASSFPRFNAGREDMTKIMDKYGIYHETHVFDDAPHSFWLFNPWFEPTLGYILEFLKKTGYY